MVTVDESSYLNNQKCRIFSVLYAYDRYKNNCATKCLDWHLFMLWSSYMIPPCNIYESFS